MVTFDPDEIWRVNRWRMVKYYGISLSEWDAMCYADQCDALEIARADIEIEGYDRKKAENQARKQTRTGTRRR